jgi:hypothetical protein
MTSLGLGTYTESQIMRTTKHLIEERFLDQWNQYVNLAIGDERERDQR